MFEILRLIGALGFLTSAIVNVVLINRMEKRHERLTWEVDSLRHRCVELNERVSELMDDLNSHLAGKTHIVVKSGRWLTSFTPGGEAIFEYPGGKLWFSKETKPLLFTQEKASKLAKEHGARSSEEYKF